MAQFRLVTLSPSPVLRRVEQPGDTIRFSKQLAVLIYLAAKPGCRASREELAGLLWGGSSSFDARQALRQLVYQVRHSTGTDLLRGEEMLSLGPGTVEFDVDLFRGRLAEGRLEEALEIHDADFLATVSLPGASEFEQWAEGLRQQLAAERRQIFRTLIERRADEGRWHDAARFAEQLASADPADLAPRIRTIELFALAGDAVRATLAAEVVRRIAAEQEGPSESSKVELAIARALAAGAAPERRASNGFPRHPEMVGRPTEFRGVVDAWKRALEGRGGAVLISGEAGIGKTRLASEVEHRLQRDRGLTVHAACYAAEQSDPFGPFIEVLRTLQGAPGLAGAVPTCLEVLAALVPEVAARFASAVAPRPLPIPPQAIAASLLDAFAAIAYEAPLALVIEDLHWAPPGTAEFAHQLARRASTTHLLLVLTARDFAGSPATMQSVRALSTSDVVINVSLGPLDRSDVEQLLGSMAQMPSDASGTVLARRVHEATDGIPLYVLEVLKTFHDCGALSVKDGEWRCAPDLCDETRQLPVPASTDAILGARLAALGEHPSAVLAALAVVGHAAPVEDLARITGLGPNDVRSAAEVLQRRRLIGRPNGQEDTWSVAHDELAAAALRSAPRAMVELCHARAADIDEERASRGVLAAFASAAFHAGHAGDGARAAALAARAAAVLEEVSGEEAGRAALGVLLGSLPASVRPDVDSALRRVLDGLWSARRWLEERSGVARRRRWLAAAAGLAAVVVFVVGVGVAVRPRPVVPLGKGYIALRLEDRQPGQVLALWLDSTFSVTPVSTDSLPLGLRAGFEAKVVRPDQSLALAPCTVPGEDPVRVCGIRLATGDTVFRAGYESDAHGVSWLPDGSAFLGDGGYLPAPDQYRRALLLFDSSGRVRETLVRDLHTYEEPSLAPQGDMIAVQRDGGRWVVVDLRGRLVNELPAECVKAVAWSPDGARLACATPDGREMMLVSVDSMVVAGRWAVGGAVSGLAWSPDGAHVVAAVDSAGTILLLLDATRLGALTRVRHLHDTSAVLLGWVPSVSAPAPLRLDVLQDTVRVAVGYEVTAPAHVSDPRGAVRAVPSAVRWWVSDSSVARVRGDGLVIGDRPGTTVLHLRSGTGLADTAVVIVSARPTPRLLSESFDDPLDSALWRPFGYPAPRVLQGVGLGGSGAFHNNGDYSHSSGIARRAQLPLENGLTLEWWAKVPLSARNWQYSNVKLVAAPADSFFLRRSAPGPGRTYFTIFADGPRVTDGIRHLNLSATGGTDAANSSLPRALLDGGWHHYRLAVYASGELRWFVDGAPALPSVHADLSQLPRATLLIEGQSVGGLVLLDDLIVWEGVALDPPVRR